MHAYMSFCMHLYAGATAEEEMLQALEEATAAGIGSSDRDVGMIQVCACARVRVCVYPCSFTFALCERVQNLQLSILHPRVCR